ncbi:fructose-6-phosphate aldolase [Clostridium algoriphilum]|uniref:fructose-6-phosphate aldolase n=1 Tax=Clostridium algoriphilum TaxID=198347 RepID=UPI001CF5625D|nr:fructose-6-phosphate aldolase [Clostridium algoriphilum]MCB2293858.1 fructose-6-phosphate aldolase [Clostridium algoriphilum]
MKYMFDTINIEDIKHYSEFYPITGITSNPSIIKIEGKINFFNHFKEIRKIIGMNKSLHIQVVSEDYDGIMAEAAAIIKNVDDKVFIKVPVTEQGLKAIRALKAKGIGVTATAIYTKVQGLLAMEAGADFIAPYYNRMENMDIDPKAVITTFAKMIEKYNYSTTILAASFKNMGQVNTAFECGAQTATIQPALLHTALKMPVIKKAVEDFTTDFETIFGKGVSIVDL